MGTDRLHLGGGATGPARGSREVAVAAGQVVSFAGQLMCIRRRLCMDTELLA